MTTRFIDIQVQNDEQVQRALARLEMAQHNLTPLMGAIAGVLADAVEDAFAQQADPATGRPWAALSPYTQQRIVGGRPRGAGPILQLSGSLAASISSEWGPDYALVGTNKRYAKTHQFGAARGAFGRTARGAPIPWGDIPARPYLGVSQDDRREILDLLVNHLLAQWTG